MKPVSKIPGPLWARNLSEVGKKRYKEVWDFVDSGAKYAIVEYYSETMTDIKSENATYRGVCDRVNRELKGCKISTHVRGDRIYLERVNYQ